MTAVAALRINGIPVVIGDLLITAPAREGISSFVPTNPAASEELKNKGSRVAGARKKVHVLHPSLAVAWAGSQLSASRVLQHLQNACAAHTGSIDRGFIERELSSLDMFTDYNFTVHLVGWICSGSSVCFRWNSAYPKEIFESEQHFEGSGEKILERILTRAPSHRTHTDPEDEASRTALITLTRCCDLIANEILTGETISNRCGYCFEVAILGENGFGFLNDITYAVWKIVEDETSENIKAYMSPIVMKYSTDGYYSIIAVFDRARAPETDIFVDVVTPVFDEMVHLDMRAISIPKVSANIYANCLIYQRGDFIATCGFATHNEKTELFRHESINGVDHFYINIAEFKKRLQQAL